MFAIYLKLIINKKNQPIQFNPTTMVVPNNLHSQFNSMLQVLFYFPLNSFYIPTIDIDDALVLIKRNCEFFLTAAIKFSNKYRLSIGPGEASG